MLKFEREVMLVRLVTSAVDHAEIRKKGDALLDLLHQRLIMLKFERKVMHCETCYISG
jgi:hypothetical protein